MNDLFNGNKHNHVNFGNEYFLLSYIKSSSTLEKITFIFLVHLIWEVHFNKLADERKYANIFVKNLSLYYLNTWIIKMYVQVNIAFIIVTS